MRNAGRVGGEEGPGLVGRSVCVDLPGGCADWRRWLLLPEESWICFCKHALEATMQGWGEQTPPRRYQCQYQYQ